ncbi:MAG: translation initiation factor IF-2 [Lachnospiraceae bacterium]|nr:translation initiation factor IF-2 [Lachnospiraceae bacterium]
MAKIKVHEIAKELEKQSKEIIAFLQNKGVEVKAPQSVIEEDTAEMVRKAFGSKSDAVKTPAAAKPAEKAVPAAEKTVPENKANAEKNPKPEAKQTAEAKGRDGRPAQGTGDQPKKKKKIIFVSNPHNSNIPGQRPQGERKQTQANKPSGQNRNGNGNGNKSGGGNRQGTPRHETPHKIIRPLTAPSVPESMQVDFKQNARRLENERIAAKNAQIAAQEKAAQEKAEKEKAEKAEKAAQEKAAQQKAAERVEKPAGQVRENYTGTPRQAPRDERRQRNERTQAGTGNNQGERNGRHDARRPESANRTGNQGGRSDFRGNGPDRNNNRPGNNNNRNERGAQGQDNRFKRPEKPGKSFVPEAPVKDDKRRDEEKRRIGQERDKKSRKDFIYEDDDAAVKNKNKAGRFIKPEKKAAEVVEEQIKVITIPDSLTIKELADKMKLQPSVIIKKLFLQGQIVTVNSEISYEDAENIAIEYEIICEKEEKVDVIEELLKEDEEAEEKLENRPPVICVMGHVDHGKTSLLDAIRKTNVTDKEAGGITQHIGAYTVNINDQSITFLDTPGHEAFTAMRMRGANSTDIAILVIAADDGVMPQTVEAINHAKAAGIEIIVAVNKIDKPGANIDRVKQEMTEYELIPVDWGGTTEFVPVSAKSGEGIENLLETILLTAEILELKANPDRRARGLVIEAELDKGRGPVATVLVQKGTLHVGDFISAGASHGKVRAMIDDKGRRVKEALPSTPVEILGLSDVPSAGEVFIAHENDKTAKSYAETYLAQNKEKMLEETKAKMSLDDLFTQIQAGNLKELNIIVKADVQGSVEAVKQSLMKLSNEEVVVKCIHGGVGAINESDVSLASASSAIIIGFNVRPDAMAKTIAEREGVDIRLYKVIYQAIEDIEAAMKGMLDPVFEEKVIGHAEVRQIFKASAVGNIAGSYILDGVFQRECKVRITREGNQIYEGALASLKRFKDDVKEVKAGFECGLVFEGFDQMQELDIVEAYIMVEVPR